MEYATPFFPGHFLLLASTANVGKSVGLATYLACTPAFQKSFARGENLADLNAKGQVRARLGVLLVWQHASGTTGGRAHRNRQSLPSAIAVPGMCLATAGLLRRRKPW